MVNIAPRTGIADTLSIFTAVALVTPHTLLTVVAELTSQQTSLSGTEDASRTVLVGGGTSTLSLYTLIAILALQAVCSLCARLRVIFLMAGSRLTGLDAWTVNIAGTLLGYAGAA